ncbi:MAG: peptide ABC transporter substrate-binding protein [Planctomycetes bacterium]|nr:peptide ABC transporter substrate-binding protein [Planctomycetota bacterium]
MDSSKYNLTEAGKKAKSFWLFWLFKSGGSRRNGSKIKGSINGQQQKDLDKKLVYSLAKTRIPNWRQLRYLKKFLTARERLLLRASFSVIIISLILSGGNFYFTHREVVPVQSGQYIEALVGTPQYINPLYATVNDVDYDISQLIFSSLLKRGPKGDLTTDLAESYETGGDGKTYKFTIREGVLWHDGSPLTVDDIIFTFDTIKDKQYKSPLRASFTGVEIEKTGERSLQFLLTDPYAAFLDLLTFGIMPAGLWRQIPPDSASLAELNIKPVGSGPFKFDKLVKDKSGVIREYYLAVNQEYYGSVPFLQIGFKFYPGFSEAVTALNKSDVNGISYLPAEFANDMATPKANNFHKLHLPQLTAIFFNQERQPALAEKTVRQALSAAINRQEIIDTILVGDAYNVDGPILPGSFAYNQEIARIGFDPTEAALKLEKAGWLLDEITAEELAQAQAEATEAVNAGAEPVQSATTAAEIIGLGAGNWRKKDGQYLTLVLTTVERTENAAVAEAIKGYWEKIGVKTDVALITADRMQTETIKPRNFQALFYGLMLGADPDPYAFWHSSQARENGLNIANFTNKEVDQLLEDARLVSDAAMRQEKYKRFQEIIADESPAIFLYSPAFTYVQSKEVKGFTTETVYLPSDRFADISSWYVKTGKKLLW